MSHSVRKSRRIGLGGWFRILLLPAVAGLVMGAACRPKPRINPALCTFKSESDTAAMVGSMTPVQWLGLISPRIDRGTLERLGPLQDACGRVLQAPEEPWPACPGQAPATVPRLGDPVEATDIVLGQVGDNRMLAWAATEELASGDAMGPAALVIWKESGLEVHATGMLRGLRRDARLRLHHTSGVLVVLLESQDCDGDERCTTVAKFFPVVGRRFLDVPVVGPDGDCLGVPSFELDRRLEQPRKGKLTRRFTMQRTVELSDEEGILLVDLVIGEEYDPKDPVGTVKPFRRVTARRQLEFVEDHFVLRDRDLWEHVLRDYGLVRTGEASVADAEADSEDEPDARQ
ncbi:MAG: hypothetical protein AB1Z98_17640 [Nannocystaceae bacterium]